MKTNFMQMNPHAHRPMLMATAPRLGLGEQQLRDSGSYVFVGELNNESSQS